MCIWVARGAVAAETPPPSVTVKDLTVQFDPSTGTLTVSHREAEIILFRLAVQAKVGGKEVCSTGLQATILPSSKSDELQIQFEKAFVLKAAVRENVVEIRVDGDFEGRAAIEGSLCANTIQHAILRDEADADKGVLVTMLGAASVPGAASVYDRERDLALTAGPSPAATWDLRSLARIQSSAPAGQPLLTLRVQPHYYRDVLGIKYYAPRREQKRWPTAPVVAMTWYGIEAMKGRPAQTMERLRPEIDWVAQHLKPYVGDNLVFQLDDNYEEKNDKVMREISDYIRSKGLVPGVWFTPFGVSPAGEQEKHPDWFLRDAQGKFLTAFAGISYKTLPDKGAKNVVLNATNPAAVKAWLGMWWKKAGETWNYDFFKIDGLPSVLSAYHKAADGGGPDGFRKGLAVARGIVGPEKFINGCSGTPVEGIGPLDGCRTGGDTGYQPHAIDIILRWNFLNNVAWWCDPDAAASLYKSEITIERVRLNAQARALTGQQFLTDDLWTQIPADKMRVWQQSFPMLDIYPVNLYEIKDWHKYDLFDLKIGKSYPAYRWGEWDVVGFFNYDGKPVEKALDLGRLPLYAGEFHIFDFWRGVYLGRFAHDAKIPMVLAAYEGKLFSVVPAPDDGPVLISTNRHVSQGGVDLNEVAWESWTIARGQSSHLVKGDPYELVFAAGKSAVAATSSSVGEVKVTRGNGVVRATIVPTDDKAQGNLPGTASWRIRFEPVTEALPELVPAIVDVPSEGKATIHMQNFGAKAAPVTLKASDPRVRLENVPQEMAAGATAAVGVTIDTAGLKAGETFTAQVVLESPGRPPEKANLVMRLAPAAPQPVKTKSGAKAAASSVWSPEYGPEKVADGNASTRWNAGQGDTGGCWIELEWDKPVTFNRVVIDEWTTLGERIQAWKLLAGTDEKSLKEIACGKKMGRKYVVDLPQPVEARRLRLVIEEASVVPSLTEIEVQLAK